MAKTLEEKITLTEALLAKYKQQQNADKIAKDILVDDEVTVKFGRGEKVRQVSGKVIAIKDDEKGNRTVAIIDPDLNVVKVSVRDILVNASATVRRVAEGGEETTEEVTADADPLAAE